MPEGDVAPDVLRTSIGLITAWATRGTGDIPSLAAFVAVAMKEHDPGDLIEAQARIACGILRGVEMAVDRVLFDSRILSAAVESRMNGRPLKAKDIGLDAGAVLARVGITSATDT